MGNSKEFSLKTKIKLLDDPAIPFLGIYPENMKTLIRDDACKPMFIATLLTRSRHVNNLSAHQQMTALRRYDIYIMECYSVIKRMKY